MRARLLAAAIIGSTALASCATGPFDGREPWEVYVQATPRGDNLVHVRTYTLAPNACYTAGEVRSAPSSQAQAIQLQTVLAGSGPYCADVLTEVVHDLPGLVLEPDDRFLEVVVSADGVERNRVMVDLAAVPPVGQSYGTGPYSPPYGA
jgi:hypothetical protein